MLVMLDVIEHLPQPFALLQAAVQTLRAGGLVVLTTGDFSSIASRATGRWWRLMTPPLHIHFFTPEGIRQLANRLGLEVLSISHPPKNVPLELIAHILGRHFKFLRGCFRNSDRSIKVNLLDAI
jgi:tRNA(Met) C34 N-acetyltransferase TmcA